ncbi:DUF3052 domain-containing protein [Kitasatospora aureofaciens]|uniref:DUF3052 domain-containing protein n=1 Tax=Kitasatospora aureofaciens TaxID=1894 RepID=UPI001C47D52F|nr:DUF3052 domain-containing protein [Kitasatospora aureofaciens]MBV6696251.1 DUF3052 domain-containing protein [Kitasatospora aureofaciens]
MAGYSGTPPARKLGIRAGDALLLVDAPAGFAVPGLPEGVSVVVDSMFDVCVWFPAGRAEYEAGLAGLRARMRPAAGLWVAWPKKSSGVVSDLDEDGVREVALPTGLVDNKVCAIDEVWSGLRLVIRRELRG